MNNDQEKREVKQLQEIPVIDIAELMKEDSQQQREQLDKVVNQIHNAMKNIGFMYIKGHGIQQEFIEKLLKLSKQFFDLPQEEKDRIHMMKNGSSWRGWFQVGFELTSGKVDQKEGYYFGVEHGKEHWGVQQGVPTFGQNVWPSNIVEFKESFELYWQKLEKIAESLLQGISLGLGLEKDYIRNRFQNDPTILFRVFNYPEHKFEEEADEFGVREHTDYGFLTILKQDQSGGLEVKTRDGEWIEAPPIEDTFVINIGDMLELWTHSVYKATPHRVKNKADHDRLSMPYFYDPSWNSSLERIPKSLLREDDLNDISNKYSNQRWDGVDISHISKDVTYGDYLWKKISKVFPELAAKQQQQNQDIEK